MLCAYTKPRYQVSVYRTIGPLVSIWVAEWPLFDKELPTRLAVCSHCILSLCNVSFPRFGYVSGFGFDCTSSCSLIICYF